MLKRCFLSYNKLKYSCLGIAQVVFLPYLCNRFETPKLFKSMKKNLFLFVLLFLMANTMTLLTSCGDDDPPVIIGPSVDPDDSDDEKILHEYTGWLSVSTRYFQDTYYGEGAVIRVYKKGDDYTCRFHDNTWGDGRFAITMERVQVNGTGTFEMPNQHSGTTKSYDATISGPMTEITISIPDVMGGTEITWHFGTKVGGTFTGINNVSVGGMYDYSAEDIEQTVTVNNDGTINLTVPEYVLTGTMMGDLTLGSYTIRNIPFNQQKGGFYKEYADGTLTLHFKAVKDGVKTHDSFYVFNNDATTTYILIKPTETGITVTNEFSMGSMPFPITATMEGAKLYDQAI